MDRLPANSPGGAHLRAAMSAYESLSEACIMGPHGPRERAAFLEASRALREWVRFCKLVLVEQYGSRILIQPSGEEAPLYRRLKADYERFLEARAAGRAYEKEQADFREGLAELRFHAAGVREEAREVMMRARNEGGDRSP